MPSPDNQPSPIVLPDDVRERLLTERATQGTDLTPLLLRIDTLVLALHTHTAAMHEWSTACHDLIAAMMEAAAADEDDGKVMTFLDGSRMTMP